MVDFAGLTLIVHSFINVKYTVAIHGNRLTLHFVCVSIRASAVILKRFKSPWLWWDFIYNLTSDGREHNDLMKTLHGFTNKVRLLALNFGEED